MRRPARTLAASAAAVALGLAASGCGDDGDAEQLADRRAEQVRAAAEEAGLPEDVADVLVLAARGTTATFRVTYAGTGGATVVVSQRPPDRRVDIVLGGSIVESRVVRDGISYECTPPDGPAPDAELDCERSDAAVDAPGAFTDRSIADFTDALAGSSGRLALTVEERTIADTAATCLVTEPKAGTPLDGDGPGVDTICLSPEGAQLLTDSGGERVVADTYTTDVPEGTFDI